MYRIRWWDYSAATRGAAYGQSAAGMAKGRRLTGYRNCHSLRGWVRPYYLADSSWARVALSSVALAHDLAKIEAFKNFLLEYF